LNEVFGLSGGRVSNTWERAFRFGITQGNLC